MDVLYLLVPLSVALVIAIGVVFWFALNGGQFDDLDGPGLSVLLDDDGPSDAMPQMRSRSNGGAAESAALDPGQSSAWRRI